MLKRKRYALRGFKLILQNPELPTGCEITAMTMAMNYCGIRVSKMEIAEKYLPRRPYHIFLGADQRAYGPDLENYFIGDPRGKGYVCGPKAVIKAANDYLREHRSSWRVLEKTGAEPQELYRWVHQGTPVVVWVTISMKERKKAVGWYTEDGKYVDWSRNDHGAVLIGVENKRVLIADPISGKVKYKKETFEKIYEDRGRKCVILSKSD